MKRIILRDWEASAFYAGRLTQLRRLVKPGSLLSESDGYKRRVLRLPDDIAGLNEMLSERQRDPVKRFCPLGGVGSQLWVAETWAGPYVRRPKIYYGCNRNAGGWAPYKRTWINPIVWNSPATMPQRFSRSTIELTAVRVERVQEVTEDEAKRCGHECMLNTDGTSGWHADRAPFGSDYSWLKAAKHCWIADHGQASWDRNDWVWVRDVRRVER